MLFTFHIYCSSICYCIILLQFHVMYYSCLNIKKQALRIMGGSSAAIGEFPYVMTIENQGLNENILEFTHVCTCSLLTPTWSITAGHCAVIVQNVLIASPKQTAVVRYNSLSLRETSVILSSVLHPRYALKSSYIGQNDIGLLQTAQVPLKIFAKLSFVDYLTLFGQKVLALGYGLTEGPNNTLDAALKVNKSLQVLEAIVVRSDGYCIFKPSFCLVGPCGQRSAICPGDSGGPVLHPSGIVGINTATDRRNCHPKTAMDPNHELHTRVGVITPVSSYVDWIAKVIG